MNPTRLALGVLGLLLALVACFALGCSVDGPFDRPPTIDPIDDDPDDDPDDGPSGGSIPCITIPGATSYLSRVLLDGKDVLRFTKSVITVSMNTDKAPRGWKSEYAGYVREAMSKWQGAGRGAYTFREVTSSTADISISWVDSLGGYTTGVTDHVIVDKQFFPPNMRIAMYADGSRLSDREVRITTIHEFGHALGFMGHSVNTKDLMFVSASVVDLSLNDQQTLVNLYCRAADITQVQARSAEAPAGARLIRQESQRDPSWGLPRVE